MLDMITTVFTVLNHFVTTLFNTYLVPNVSIGSLILLSLLFYVVVSTIWIRR